MQLAGRRQHRHVDLLPAAGEEAAAPEPAQPTGKGETRLLLESNVPLNQRFSYTVRVSRGVLYLNNLPGYPIGPEWRGTGQWTMNR